MERGGRGERRSGGSEITEESYFLRREGVCLCWLRGDILSSLPVSFTFGVAGRAWGLGRVWLHSVRWLRRV